MNTLNNDSNPLVPISPVSPEPTTRRSRRTFLATILFIIFACGLALGFVLGVFQRTGEVTYEDARAALHLDRTEDRTDETVEMSLFWKVWDLVRERHVDQPVNETDLFYGSIAGMVAALGDPYSIFFEPEETQEFLEEINGSFEGIGIEIGLKNEKMTVIAPLAGTPAEVAGLRAGDRILAIDGLDTAYMSVNTAVDYIRGEKGKAVVLTIQRDGVADPFEVSIVRDTIHIESVKWEMIHEGQRTIALITITHFNSDTAGKFQEAMNALLLEQPDSIILDLRNNPGGYLDAAVQISSKFLAEGSVVLYEQSSNSSEKVYPASGAAPLSGLETVALINEGSASASEIVAGALRDNDAATLIGKTSFGKGTVQDLQTFDDGSSLKLTVAQWLTPDKNRIDTVGVHPDYAVDRTNEDYSADRDPQLDAAKLFLSDQAVFLQQHERFVPEETKE